MKKNSIKINVIFQMLYEVFAICLPLITSPYVSRVLGAEKLGIYSYSYSIATYFGMISMLGIKNHGNREIAKSKSSIENLSATFINIYSIQLFFSALLSLVYVIYVFNFVYSDRNIALIQIIYILSCMIDISWLYFGLEQFKKTSLINISIKILSFIMILAFVKNANDLWKYSLILAAGSFGGQILLWFDVKKYVIYIRPSWNQIKKNIKPMVVLFIPVLATSIYFIMDKIMIGSISTKTELGLYENSEKLINCAKTVVLSIGTVMMPRISSLVASGQKEIIKKYMSQSIELIMMISFAFTFGIMSVATIFAPLYWGSEFASCDALLKGLSITLPLSAFGNFVRTQYMIPNNKDVQYIVAVCLSSIINLVVNVILIPQYGAKGAVVGTIVAEAGICVIQCVLVRKEFSSIFYIKKVLPFLIIGLIMYACVTSVSLYVQNGFIDLGILIICGVVVYSSCVLGYLIFTQNEFLGEILKKLWRKK